MKQFYTDNCTTGEIRLAGGSNPSVGRVEICIDGEWGTICDSSWTASDAAVVCRQMGFPSSGTEHFNFHNNYYECVIS